MRGIDGIGNLVLVVMAAASLVSMIAAISLEGIISNDLYSYGLQFSYSWLIPYWNTIGIIFAMAWVNIIVAIAFQIYRIRTIRKEERQHANEQFEDTLESEDEQRSADSDGWGEKIYEVAIDNDQTETQEAEEQAQIVQYESVTCQQTEPTDSEQTEE